MNRGARTNLARQMLEIIDRGSYESAFGRNVDVANMIKTCVDTTRLFEPAELEAISKQILQSPSPGFSTKLEIVNETTLAGVDRLSASRGPVPAVLNFASAKNPGGGFLGGSQAQEESLARSSALYPSLLSQMHFYDRHRASPSMLYSDTMILSPNCPVFRNDAGGLLDSPQLATFITSPAPNAGAAATNRPQEVGEIPSTLRRRAGLVLALAAHSGYTCLILGAWGCGVFRNDPALVADAFVGNLCGVWEGRFERVIFSVLDTSADQTTYRVFEKAIGA